MTQRLKEAVCGLTDTQATSRLVITPLFHHCNYMETKTVTLYTFCELSQEAQKNVVKQCQDEGLDCDPYWYQVLEWDMQDELKALGYDDPKVLFSGFGSQGDGACFTATIDVEKWITTHKKEKDFPLLMKNPYEVKFCITHSWQYYYSTSTDVEYECHDTYENECQKLQELIEKEREELGKKFYKQLEELYDELTSEGYIREMLGNSEELYTVDGKIPNV